MKPNQTIGKVIVALLLVLAYNTAKSQVAVTADTIKNTCVIEGEETNVSDILFRLCDSTVMKLSVTNGNVQINSNLQIPNGNLLVDSIRTRAIHIGDSSITIGSLPPVGNTFGGNNFITATGDLFIQSGNSAPNTILNQTNGNVGIGAGANLGVTGPQEKLHIHRWSALLGPTLPSYALFSNGYSNTNTGFKIGIDSFRNAEVRQQLNQPLNFFTHDTIRVTILGNGKVGIGDFFTVEPKKRLDVFDSTDAQLRLTYEPWAALNRLTFTDFKTTAGGNLLIRPFKNLNGDPHLTNADYGVVGICMGTLPDYYSGGTPGPIVNNQYLALDVNGQQNLRTVTQDTTLEKCSRGG